MPWYGWLLLALAVGFAIVAVTLRIWRSSRKGRRFRKLSTRAKIDFGRTLLTHPDLPLLDKVALGILVGYLALPLDIIPDFIPVIGQLDDFVVVTVALILLSKTIPDDVFDAAIRTAEEADERRRIQAARTIEGRSQPTSLPPPT